MVSKNVTKIMVNNIFVTKFICLKIIRVEKESCVPGK